MDRKISGLPMAALLMVVGLAGCGQGSQAVSEQEAAVSAEDLSFLNDNQAWRIERHSRLVQPDGWTSLVGLHWLTLKAHYIGSGATSGMANAAPVKNRRRGVRIREPVDRAMGPSF